jgi:antitoxin PrlF
MGKAAEILEIPATITERGQTTVPAAVRKMLGLDKRGRVVFRGLADGTVVIAKAKEAGAEIDDDPVLGHFLAFLERDMAERPQAIRAVPRSLVERARALVERVEVDLEAALPDDEA